MTKLSQLTISRSFVIERIKDIFAFANEASGNPLLKSQFKVRYDQLNSLYTQFLDLSDKIIIIYANQQNAADELASEKQITKEIDDYYYETCSIYSDLFPEAGAANTSSNVVVNSSFNTMPATSNVKLPKLEIPLFSGDCKTWPTFRDMFNSLVHNQPSLSNVEKMQYLFSRLSNEPLNLVKGFPLTNDNYKAAYDTLIERYDNKRRLATSYWRDIQNAAPITYPSTKSFRKLLDTFTENLKILEKLDFPVNQWDFILLNLLLDKLDKESRQAFEIEHSIVEVPTYKQLQVFIENRAQALEFVSPATSSSKAVTYSKPSSISSIKQKSSFVSTTASCTFCDSGNHFINKCSQFLSKSPKERFECAKDKGLCINCLRNTHRANKCNSSSCKECGSKHNTLLHFSNNSRQSSSSNAKQRENDSLPRSSVTSETSVSNDNKNNNGDSTPTINTLTSTYSSTILLSTAEIEVLDSRGQPQIIRVLLDSASQGHFITEKTVNRLGLSRRSVSTPVQGLGHQTSLVTKGISSLVIRPRGCTKPSYAIEAMILPKICANMPTMQINSSNWKHIENLPLADTRFATPGTIDMLLGADIFPLILKLDRRVGDPNQPVALDTEFGYILMGRVELPREPSVHSFFISMEPSLDNTLKKFWELETLPATPTLSKKEIEAQQCYESTVSRTETGRYIVSLSFDGPEPQFRESRLVALQRFDSLERKLIRDPLLQKLYTEFMEDYEQNNHMEVVQNDDNDNAYYIPHHCILKPDSLTTKLRVVFDASARTPQGISLNDCLLIGPKLQIDVVTLLLRFRLHSIAITSDIRQMYRQIQIQSSHRDFQRIIWRSSPSNPIQDYRLNTVTYGVSATPYLAIRTLLQLASDEQTEFPIGASVLRTDTYVDDIVTGCDSIDQAQIVTQQLIGLLQKGGFKLHKWASNNTELLSTLPKSEQVPLSFDSDSQSTIKVLGLQWLPSEDVFTYKSTTINRTCTKRAILSELARIFDPLGFLTPVTFFAKHLMQLLWCLGLSWDAIPPLHITSRWLQYKNELSCLSEIQIPRHLFINDYLSCQLHGFADASELGYAAAVYVRLVHADNSISSKLVIAKSKVAPLKTISIPRLELCAASLLADLLSFVLDTFKTHFSLDSVFAWSDSKVALAWLTSPPYKWKTFVGNRVSHIQERIPPSRWRHVCSQDNPADCASRGLLPLELKNHPIWWSGPKFLQLSEDNWTKEFSQIDRDALPSSFVEEEKRLVLVSVNPRSDGIEYLLNRYSSLNKILRIISYCRRLTHFKRNNPLDSKKPFTSHELHDSLVVLVKYVQQSVFADDIQKLRENKPCSKTLRKLNPFIDSSGVVRVGGRLLNASLEFDQKHPALLPRSHRMTELLIEDYHQRYHHPGLKTLQRLQQDFWKRWHQEYLHTLQQRSKWTQPDSKIEVGKLVLIKSENLPPLQWPLGRIVELHKGKDGIARVATIKTKGGTFKRPLVKICPLPCA